MHKPVSRWRRLIGGCLLWGAGLAHGDAAVAPGDAAVEMNDTREFTLASAQTGRDYLIQVALPRGPRPDAGFPVLYLLDGNLRFPLTVAARETLFHGGAGSEPSPWMIVAIGYPGAERLDAAARAEDFTPPAEDLSDTGDPGGNAQGGAGRFLAFLEERLKPEIAARFPVDESRQALFGHSYGGLFTLYAMLERPGAFSDYIAISPSLWWNGRYLFEALDGVVREADALDGRRLLIGAGGREQSPRPGEEGTERAARRLANAMIDNAREAAERLERDAPGLAVTFVCFPDEDHGSVVWPATRDALTLLHDSKLPGKGECG